MTHADVLMKMADFQRRLVAMATQMNGLHQPWYDERMREIHALEAGAIALAEKEAAK